MAGIASEASTALAISDAAAPRVVCVRMVSPPCKVGFVTLPRFTETLGFVPMNRLSAGIAPCFFLLPLHGPWSNTGASGERGNSSPALTSQPLTGEGANGLSFSFFRYRCRVHRQHRLAGCSGRRRRFELLATGQLRQLRRGASEPGMALPLVYYHSKADEGGSATFPRNGRITAGVNARADFVFIAPTYIFA